VNPAELLVPALRWNAERGFADQRDLIEEALELGAGGFIFFGGPASEVRDIIAELRTRSRVPLLIGADLERGAGQQFPGCTGLPPLAALGSLDDPEVMRAAGSLTASEARSLGINWVYAPVLDLDIEPDNPIVGTRAISGNPGLVAHLGRAWIEGCQGHHVLACAKHFPGHGRTTTDSHAELPVVSAGADALERTDLLPFAEAVDAGVAAVMTAHVSYPALDPQGGPATLSPAILRAILRQRLGFGGLIVTDALIMEGVLEGATEATASVRALAAGCDLLLYPTDFRAVASEIQQAIADGLLDPAELKRSAGRRGEWAAWAADGPAQDAPDVEWARTVACRVIHELRGAAPSIGDNVRLTVIDDDLGGPYPPPSRTPFIDALHERGVEIHRGEASMAVHVIALFGDIRAWKGRPGYSAAAIEQVRAAVSDTVESGIVLVQFSHPRLADALPENVPTVCAWGGEAAMQVAAAEWLVNRCRGG
jgi:beta-glucosidase-like glycosyl hydrolase